jgi:hypothetical protein
VKILRRSLALAILLLLAATGSVWAAAAPPVNDNRDSAQSLNALPATVTGTTVGATVETNEPASGCARTAGSVWYLVSFGASPPAEVGVKLQANSDLDAAVDVFTRQRSQNIPVSCAPTHQSGFAGTTFAPSADTSYLIRVAQRANSTPGTFTLQAFVVPPAPALPGHALPVRGGHGVLDSLFNTQDVYSQDLQAGTTYKFNLVNTGGGCMTLGMLPPGTTSLSVTAAAGLRCAGYRLFTPQLSGRWSFLVSAAPGVDGAQPYTLHVAPATSLEMAPGIFLANLTRYTGVLRGNEDTDVRLFRLDVTSYSELTLALRTSDSFDLKLLSDQGRELACQCGSEGDQTIQRAVRPGRYFVAVSAENFASGRFTLSRDSRAITHTHVSFDGLGYEQISPGSATHAIARVSSATDGPVTFELEYFDPLAGWQFRGYYHAAVVDGSATLDFTPSAVGHWRVTAVYAGTRSTGPSSSGWANLFVTGPLTQ